MKPKSMELVTVTFDRVFDIVRMASRGRQWTEFGFEAGPLRKYAVPIEGEPKIEAGMTVSVVLRKPGDWQTLVGWVDHRTGEISCRGIGREFGSLAMLPFFSVWALGMRREHPGWAVFILWVGFCFFMGGVVGARDSNRARSLLEARRKECQAAWSE